MFNLGKFSKGFALIGVIFLIITGSFCVFPQSYPVNEIDTFDWTIVITPGFVLIGVFYWIFYSRHTFKGPLCSDSELTQEVITAPDGDIQMDINKMVPGIDSQDLELFDEPQY
jgi:hypothetical protein